MKLFISTASPYARTAQVTLREVGLDPSAHEQITHPFNNEAAFIQSNPMSKVPSLTLDNGQTLFDSEVICQYLDETFNQSQLWQSVQSNWSLRTLYSQVSGMLDLAVALRQEDMRAPEGHSSPFWKNRWSESLERSLTDLNAKIVSFPVTFSLLHINSVCLLDYLSFRHPRFIWRDHKNLVSFYLQWSNRESFALTNPKD